MSFILNKLLSSFFLTYLPGNIAGMDLAPFSVAGCYQPL
jgi:hypothetical protein